MKFDAYDRKSLLATLKQCMPGIDTKNPILPGADCFIFRDNMLCTFNDFSGVTVPFPAEFKGAVPYDTFFATVNGFSGKEIHIAQEGDVIHLKCGKAKATVRLLDEIVSSRFESLLTEDLVWKPIPEGLSAKMESCLLSGLSKWAGVFMSGNDMLSTDGTAIVKEDIDAQIDPIWLSHKSVKQLVKFGDFTEYAKAHSWVHFRKTDLQYSTHKLHETEFCEAFARKHLDTHSQLPISVNIPFNEEMLASMKRALIFADKGTEAKVVGIKVEQGSCFIVTNSGAGGYSDEFPIGSDKEVKISFQVDLSILLGALGGMKSGNIGVISNAGRKVLYISGGGRTAVVGTIIQRKDE